MPLHSKNKGSRGEREAAEKIKLGGFDAWRGQQFKGTEDSPDVECPALSDFHIECKFVERFQLYPAIDQCLDDAPNKIPLVLHRRKRKPWVAVLPLDSFLELCRKAGYETIPGFEPDSEASLPVEQSSSPSHLKDP